MDDRPPEEIAADLTAAAPGWVVMWSPWRRCFTAFAACTPDACILDHPSKDHLIGWMRQVQLAASNAARR